MPRVQMETLRTAQAEPEAAAEDLLKQIQGQDPKLVVMFASRERDHLALNKALRGRLPKGTRLVGASSGGEVDNQGFHQGNVVAAALSGDFEVGLGLGTGLAADAVTAGSNAIKRASEELGLRPQDLDSRRHVGLVIDDGFKSKKEELLLGVLEKNQSLMLVGGGASDGEQDPSKQSAVLHVDGEVADDAVITALFQTDAPWGALRSHWYLPTGETITITKVDDTHTRALELDGQPAAKRYAELLGVGIDELEYGKPNGFSTRPTALRVGREYFLRSPWMPLPDGSILFANLVEEDMELELMKLGDMAGMTRDFFTKELPQKVQNPQGALLFNCSGRIWYANTVNKVPEFGAAFADAPPAAGLNAYFEIYSGFHINTTMTSLVFGAST